MSAKAKVRRERKLPVQQLSILAICRFAEPIASTSLFPYLPEMVKSFHVPEDEVGKYAGLCSAMFSLCQAIMGIPWGRFSDQYGRKPAILIGLVTTMITTLMWGFSTTLPMAIIARALAGAGNGNVGIIRTTVAEMVPFKELQPRAFSLMPLVWNVGSIFGPTIGGALANPFNVKPGQRLEHPNLLQRFPYALPNIVAACLFAVGITVGVLFLEETLETRQHRRDCGLVLGRKLKSAIRKIILKVKDCIRLRKAASRKGTVDNEQEPLIAPQPHDEETLSPESSKPAPSPPSYKEVLNKQAVLNLIVYTFLALHTMAYDQLLPVYMQYPPIGSKPRDDVPPPSMSRLWSYSNSVEGNSGNPLKFSGGFGLDHFRIGLISTVYGICGMLTQFFLFPPIARRFGVLNCLKACACVFPITYFVTPFTALLPTTTSRIACCFAIMLVKCWCAIFAFPCSTILLTNSASSLRVLGTLNGIATSVSAIGRGLGPAMGGAMFTLGVERGYVIAPWWLFAAIAILAAIPVFFLVEGEGFGGDDDHVSDEESDDEGEEEGDGQSTVQQQQSLQARALEGEAQATGKPGPEIGSLPIQEEAEEEQAETAYGSISTLSRTTTASSPVTFGSGEHSSYFARASAGVSRQVSHNSIAGGSVGPGRFSGAPSSPGDANGTSAEASTTPALSRRGSRRVRRRMSVPLGMGGRAISRRYSSNLGQSFGSAGGNHGH